MHGDRIDSEKIEVEVVDETAEIEAHLTEGGDIEIELLDDVGLPASDEMMKRMSGEESGKIRTFTGRSGSGHLVELRRATFTPKIDGGRFLVNNIRSSEIVFDSSRDDAIVDKEVTVEVDMMNFAPRPPHTGELTDVPLLNHDDFTATISFPENIEQRIDTIKEFRRPLRTGKIQITQKVNRSAELQIKHALEWITHISELLSFLQGVHPSPIRAELVSVGGNKPNHEYKSWCPVYTKSIGHAFKGERIIWTEDYYKFLEDCYSEYVEVLRDKYKLNIVFSWYLDAINRTRSLDSQFASICSGIELLAKRHSDLGPRHSETEDRITYLVNKLDVEVRDLAEFAGSYEDSKLDDEEYANEYFYEHTRQYVVHGDNLAPDFDVLYRDYMAALKLFQRLLRNQLIDKADLEKYSSFGQLEPKDKRYKR